MFRLVKLRSELTVPGYYLFRQTWNDYWEYETLFLLVHLDENGEERDIGQVKIGQYSKVYTREDPQTDIPTEFESLEDDFYSLGQSDTYYEALEKLGSGQRVLALSALGDIAFSSKVYDQAKKQQCAKVSLFRFVSPQTVTDQYRRLAHGGARLTDYSFSYSFPKSVTASPSQIRFDVLADSKPPTNIHVLIGRNGVGKTTLLDSMARSFVLAKDAESVVRYGSFSFDQLSDSSSFVNIVSVSFSAFDSFSPLTANKDRTKGPLYEYIGLKKDAISTRRLKQIAHEESRSAKTRSSGVKLKDIDDLTDELLEAARYCMNGAYLRRWKRAISLLGSDPLFARTGITEIVDSIDWSDEDGLSRAEFELSVLKELRSIFEKLSSGHKIVMLTISRLVQAVSEKTLVLIDEPEAHLHPPLLSAFNRALSDLLSDRNGVAIVATHSPVILQEVPKSCVWILNRTGAKSKISKPRIETFGENVGILTSEVFGLEVTDTGFHQRLFDAAMESRSYEEALAQFGGQLGDEGRIILESMSLEKLEV
jgi:predicted ATPase